MRIPLLSLLVLAASACDGADVNLSPDLAMGKPSKADATLLPSDYTTNWRTLEATGGTLGANIADPNATLDQAGFQQVAQTALLRTWPALDPVGANLTTRFVAGGTSTVTLAPGAPLADRWYVVSLQTPAAWRFPGFPLSDGAAGARFRYGSEPRFITVKVCGTDTATTFSLGFSEPVNTSVADEQRVTIRHEGAGGPTCAGITDHAKPAGLSLDFSCTAVDPKLPLHFVIAAGLVSPTSMLPVDNGDPIDRSTTLQDLPESGYCRTIRFY
jgi:hypothetical protein